MKTALFDWIVLVLLIVSRLVFCHSPCALPGGGWFKNLKVCMAVKNRLAALVLRAFIASNACFARDEISSKRVGCRWAWPKTAKATFVALHSAESRQSCSRRNRCWQNGIDIARCRVIHAAGKRRELAVRHADLRREATTVMANRAPALLYDIAVWYLVWVCGGMSNAMGSKNNSKTFRLSFSSGRSSRNNQAFRLDLPAGKLSKEESK